MTKALHSLLFGSAATGTVSFEIIYTLFRFYCGFSLALKPTALAAGLLLLPVFGFSQTQAPVRVSFTISNPALRGRLIDIRYFDPEQKKPSGYGYQLAGLSSHAVNMPAGTRVYIQKDDTTEQLIFVVTTADGGRKFDISRPYEISREQRLQAARDEVDEQSARQATVAERPDLAAVAKEKGIDMVDFVVAGKTLWGRQVYVRAQLPFDNQKSNLGFSRKLSGFSRFQVSYPVGTKVYLCDGPYWNGKPVKEQLLLSVDEGTRDELIRI